MISETKTLDPNPAGIHFWLCVPGLITTPLESCFLIQKMGTIKIRPLNNVTKLLRKQQQFLTCHPRAPGNRRYPQRALHPRLGSDSVFRRTRLEQRNGHAFGGRVVRFRQNNKINRMPHLI